METRILIPKQLRILLNNSQSLVTSTHTSSKEKYIKSEFEKSHQFLTSEKTPKQKCKNKRKKLSKRRRSQDDTKSSKSIKQKPTSSSGCDAESETETGSNSDPDSDSESQSNSSSCSSETDSDLDSPSKSKKDRKSKSGSSTSNLNSDSGSDTEIEKDGDDDENENSNRGKDEDNSLWSYNLRKSNSSRNNAFSSNDNLLVTKTSRKKKRKDIKPCKIPSVKLSPVKIKCESVSKTNLVTIANADSINQIEMKDRDKEKNRDDTKIKRENNEHEEDSNKTLKICAARKIEKGMIFGPNDGEVQIVHLKNVPSIRNDDIRFLFGCFDRTILEEKPESDLVPESEGESDITDKIKVESRSSPESLISSKNESNSDNESSSMSQINLKNKRKRKKSKTRTMTTTTVEGTTNKSIRLCNWLRFARQAEHKSDQRVNVHAKFVERKAVLEFTQNVNCGTELVVYFDVDSLAQNVKGISENMSQSQRVKGNNTNQMAPLDLSHSKLQLQVDHGESLLTQKNENSRSRSNSPENLNLNLCNNYDDSDTQTEQNLDHDRSPSASPSLSPASPSPQLQIQIQQSEPQTPEAVIKGQRKDSQQRFFPFSIQNVLQPHKLFQPYNTRDSGKKDGGHSHDNSKFPIIHSGLGSGIHPSFEVPSTRKMRHSNNNNNNNNANLNLMNLQMNLNLHQKNSSANANVNPNSNSQTMTFRPILRTRGRERSLLPCEVCGKAFDRPSLLKRHMRTHSGEKPYICDVCSKGFSTSSSLNTHRRIHSGEKPHQCPICGKRFTASSNLYYHRMTHNKEKPHKCHICGKSFPTPGDLKSHQYVHSGSWPYNCPVCHRGFSKQTNLRNHLLLHSGDKPHNCNACGKKFALACNLRAHIRTHEEEPISSCLSCKRTFLSSLNMLENGQCRACLIHQQQNQSQNQSLRQSHNSRNIFTGLTLSSSGSGSGSGSASSGKPSTSSPNSNSGLTSPVIGIGMGMGIGLNMDNHPNHIRKSPENHIQLPSLAKIPRGNNNNNPGHNLFNLNFSSSGNPVAAALSAASHIPGLDPDMRNDLLSSLPLLANSPFHFNNPNANTNQNLNHNQNQNQNQNASLSLNPGGGNNNLNFHGIGLGLGNPASPYHHLNGNPFLEQLFQWNWRFAKETNLNLSLQKLLESQMLAQLMSVSSAGANGEGGNKSDILKFRL